MDAVRLQSHMVEKGEVGGGGDEGFKAESPLVAIHQVDDVGLYRH